MDNYRAYSRTDYGPQKAFKDLSYRFVKAGKDIQEYLESLTGRNLKYAEAAIPEGRHRLRLEFSHRMLQGDRVQPGYYVSCAWHPEMGCKVEAGYKDGWGRVVERRTYDGMAAESLTDPKELFGWVKTGVEERRKLFTPDDDSIQQMSEMIWDERVLEASGDVEFASLPLDEDMRKLLGLDPSNIFSPENTRVGFDQESLLQESAPVDKLRYLSGIAAVDTTELTREEKEEAIFSCFDRGNKAVVEGQYVVRLDDGREDVTLGDLSEDEVEEFYNLAQEALYGEPMSLVRVWLPGGKRAIIVNFDKAKKVLAKCTQDSRGYYVCPKAEVAKELERYTVALNEKAVSRAQQKIMGMALALKRGEISPGQVSGEVRKIAGSMALKDLEKFARTKHVGLPYHVGA